MHRYVYIYICLEHQDCSFAITHRATQATHLFSCLPLQNNQHLPFQSELNISCLASLHDACRYEAPEPHMLLLRHWDACRIHNHYYQTAESNQRFPSAFAKPCGVVSLQSFLNYPSNANGMETVEVLYVSYCILYKHWDELNGADGLGRCLSVGCCEVVQSRTRLVGLCSRQTRGNAHSKLLEE